MKICVYVWYVYIIINNILRNYFLFNNNKYKVEVDKTVCSSKYWTELGRKSYSTFRSNTSNVSSKKCFSFLHKTKNLNSFFYSWFRFRSELNEIFGIRVRFVVERNARFEFNNITLNCPIWSTCYILCAINYLGILCFFWETKLSYSSTIKTWTGPIFVFRELRWFYFIIT